MKKLRCSVPWKHAPLFTHSRLQTSAHKHIPNHTSRLRLEVLPLMLPQAHVLDAQSEPAGHGLRQWVDVGERELFAGRGQRVHLLQPLLQHFLLDVLHVTVTIQVPENSHHGLVVLPESHVTVSVWHATSVGSFRSSLKTVLFSETSEASVFVCVCVYLCERERQWQRESVCVCVCICERETECMCVSLCVCVCVRERDRDTVSESVCMCVYWICCHYMYV